jgi:hypothetical protein
MIIEVINNSYWFLNDYQIEKYLNEIKFNKGKLLHFSKLMWEKIYRKSLLFLKKRGFAIKYKAETALKNIYFIDKYNKGGLIDKELKVIDNLFFKAQLWFDLP